MLTLRRRVQVMVRNTLRELAVHFVFLLIVCSLCYGNRSRQDFRLFDIVNGDLVQPKIRIPPGSGFVQNRFFSQVTTYLCVLFFFLLEAL